jgi:glycosyltransferase involved in cell wall biosynthesis
MRINFITNVPRAEISGGFSAMNAAACEALEEIAEVHYVGPVNPRPSFVRKVSSKLQRRLGRGGSFFFFAEPRLRGIASAVAAGRRADADCDFFHGFTPWVHCRRPVPYVAWSDCCFRDYVEIYHPSGSFHEEDIRRICRAEADWMAGSQGIFLSSEWARLHTKDYYHLTDTNLGNVGIFGAMAVPAEDAYERGLDFLFVSTDYVRKNGPLCRKAIERIWQDFPEARLTIIGAAPPARDLTDSRVQYVGYFDKSDPKQLEAFTNHISRAFALVHPTAADTTAMIVIEAAFHGCPSITVDDFALPEVTGNGTYAVLLKRPITPESLAHAMKGLLADEKHYRALRTRARELTIERFSRAAFKKRLQDAVLCAVAAAGRQ